MTKMLTYQEALDLVSGAPSIDGQRYPLAQFMEEQQRKIERLQAALKVTHQAILEFNHAQECGPNWYTGGEPRMYQQVRMWIRKGLDAVKSIDSSLEPSSPPHPGPSIEKAFARSPRREWNFDRYRDGKLMAQGVKVHASNYAEAYQKAVSLLFIDGNKPSDELKLVESQVRT